MKKTVLRNYAKLIAKVGAKVEKGQEVIIFAELDQPEFVSYVVDECYKCGAKKVTVEWNYQPLTKLHYRHRSVKTLSFVENWEIEKFKRRIEVLPCLIYLISEDPDGLKGINMKKMMQAQHIRHQPHMLVLIRKIMFSLYHIKTQLMQIMDMQQAQVQQILVK